MDRSVRYTIAHTAVAVCAIVFSAACSGDVAGTAPAVSFNTDATSPAYGAVEARPFTDAALAAFRAAGPTRAQWERVFPVHTGDTAGPSLHILVKLLSTITLVLAPLFI